MKHKHKINLLFIAFAVMAVGFPASLFFVEFGPSPSLGFETAAVLRPAPRRPLTASNGEEAVAVNEKFFESDLFGNAMAAAKNVTAQNDLNAIIVPHHLVASELVAQAFKRASGRVIRRAVVIGPNHENIGTAPMAAARLDWATAFGHLNFDNALTDKFLAGLDLKPDPAALRNEHSVGALMPFIRYYFGAVTVMPVVVSSYAGYGDMKRLSTWLEKNFEDGDIVIFSLDFSHYLDKNTADQKDEITRSLIATREIGRIFELDNDYVDSPAILALSLLWSGAAGLRAEIMDHGNSFDFAADKPSYTTSYFTIGFK